MPTKKKSIKKINNRGLKTIENLRAAIAVINVIIQ